MCSETQAQVEVIERFGAKPISIGDRSHIEGYFERFKSQASEYSFANLYVWREYRPIQWYIRNEHLFFCYLNDGELIHLQPLGSRPREMIVDSIVNYSLLKWRRIESCLVQNIDLDTMVSVQSDRDNWDYLYAIEEQRGREGSSFKIIRKQLNKFEAQSGGRYRVEIINNQNISDCHKINELWVSQKKGEDAESCRKDASVCTEFLDLYDQFGAHGIIIYINERPATFTIGLPGFDGHFISHFAKSDLSIEGISVKSFYAFVESLHSSCGYVNLMQDCGDPGMKSWKQSCRPACMVEKSMIDPLVI